MYIPLYNSQINILAGCEIPSTNKNIDNYIFSFWQRALFQRACSVIILNVPAEWDNERKDFLYYSLFKYGFVAVFELDKYGKVFQPCTLGGYDLYYQPTRAVISNPALDESLELTINEECSLIKLTPDYRGIFDIINYYAEKLSLLDPAIDMSIINSKFAYILAAKSKSGAAALKKVVDKINSGQPTIITDKKVIDDLTLGDGKSPFESFERSALKQNYITDDLLMSFQTLINNFDSEIGIPVLPYQKKERMVTSEAESKIIDSTSRSVVWFDTLSEGIKKANEMFDLNMSISLRYEQGGKYGKE